MQPAYATQPVQTQPAYAPQAYSQGYAQPQPGYGQHHDQQPQQNLYPQV